eukprot:CAMPEP_0113452416 /NCGR_PEP_ID=MMETSP0014_2-20120614/6835_1 /TAXON_ID=2857 /ORGANISM="Nitzschia sp." /LENGTH=359 /DNA_ID=CAMNT_0000343787 /DNA_START=383 /DNA_END=1462 /DNA_ORIENTATION=+ /assembly_acc=CAM_ASM_000159
MTMAMAVAMKATGRRPVVSAFTVPLQRPELLRMMKRNGSSSNRLILASSSSSSSGTMATLSPDEEEQYDDDGDGDEDFLPASTQAHALEVFYQYASKTSDEDTDLEGKAGGGTISKSSDLFQILNSLDVEATEDEADVLFRYLDGDGDGLIDFEDFLPWYLDAAEAACSVRESFQSLLVGRRTIDVFDQTPVSKDVLERAVQCAIAAPNRSCSEPWRFIDVGAKTVQAFAALNVKLSKGSKEDDEDDSTTLVDWTKVPGWTVVTTKISPDNHDVEQEDFKSVCCAIQNFMLSMWSEGVGTKWAVGHVQRTQEFAELCGVDTLKERVVGCVWYGYANGGTRYADPRRRKKTVKDVLSNLP